MESNTANPLASRPGRLQVSGELLPELAREARRQGAIVTSLELVRGCNALYVLHLQWPGAIKVNFQAGELFERAA